jgi:integrase
MAREIERLSALKVSRLKRPGLHADGGGLYLQIKGGSAKSWLYRFKRNGRARDMGLGPVITVSLADARAAAAEARKQCRAGIDPIAHRRAERAALRLTAAKGVTFKECAADYVKAHAPGWRNAKHKQQWENTIATYAEPILGALPIHEVDTALVLKVLEPIWRTRTETAKRLRGRLESILDWAKARGYRDGENPARWRGHLDKLLAAPSKVRKHVHHAALAYDDMPDFMARLRAEEGTAARALEFLILTVARTGEVIGARKPEIQQSTKAWIVPAGRMKAGREHRVPLSKAALVIAEKGALQDPEFLFPGRRAKHPLSNMAMSMLLRRLGYDKITVHGFRSTFRDWAAERTNYPRELAEMALAHMVADETEGAYLRTDMFEKRRRLAEDWAKFCGTPKMAGTVVTLHGQRA